MAIEIPVDGLKFAEAAANLAVAYERLNLAIAALEEATGIEFRAKVAEEFRAEQPA